MLEIESGGWHTFLISVHPSNYWDEYDEDNNSYAKTYYFADEHGLDLFITGGCQGIPVDPGNQYIDLYWYSQKGQENTYNEFKIYRSIDGGDSYSSDPIGTRSYSGVGCYSFRDSGARYNHPYTYKIYTDEYHDFGAGTPTDGLTSPVPGPPTISVSEIGTDWVTLDINSNGSYVSKYKVYYNTEGEPGEGDPFEEFTAGSEYKLTPSGGACRYYMRVMAFNSNPESESDERDDYSNKVEVSFENRILEIIVQNDFEGISGGKVYVYHGDTRREFNSPYNSLTDDDEYPWTCADNCRTIEAKETETINDVEYAFSHWSDGESQIKTTIYEVSPTSNTTYTAHFVRPITIRVQNDFDGELGGVVIIEGEQISLDSDPYFFENAKWPKGECLTIEAITPQTHNSTEYLFHHWTCGGETCSDWEHPHISPCPTENTTYIAHFIPRIIRVPQKYDKIQEAIDAAVPGCIVEVGPGTYNEYVGMKSGVDLIGAGASVTTIGPGPYPDVVVDGSENCKIEGFKIAGVMALAFAFLNLTSQ